MREPLDPETIVKLLSVTWPAIALYGALIVVVMVAGWDSLTRGYRRHWRPLASEAWEQASAYVARR